MDTILLILSCLLITLVSGSQEATVASRKELPEICRTDMITTFFNIMVVISPYWKGREFFLALREMREDLCQHLSTIGRSSNINELSKFKEKYGKFCKDHGVFYSDFEWKCKSLMELLLDQGFAEINKEIFHILGPNDEKSRMSRNLIRIVLKYKENGENLKIFLEYEALLANIILHYRPTRIYHLLSAAHKYFEDLDKGKSKTRIAKMIELPTEKRDPDDEPVDIFVHIFNYFILVLFGACVVYNIYWYLIP